MTTLKVIIMATFLSSLFSCNNNKSDNLAKTKSIDTLVGSTLENINNSEHSVIQFQIDGKMCFATINQYFKNYNNKSDFPFSLWVTVETLEKNEEGHPCFGPLNNQTKLHIKNCNFCLWKDANSARRRRSEFSERHGTMG